MFHYFQLQFQYTYPECYSGSLVANNKKTIELGEHFNKCNHDIIADLKKNA